MNIQRKINPLFKISSPFPIQETHQGTKQRKSNSRNPTSTGTHHLRASQQTERMLELVSSSCKLLEREPVPWKKTPSAKRQFRLQSAIIRSKRLGLNSKDPRAESQIDGYKLAKVSRPALETNFTTQSKQKLITDSEIVEIEPPAGNEISQKVKCFGNIVDAQPINNIVSSPVVMDSKRSHQQMKIESLMLYESAQSSQFDHIRQEKQPKTNPLVLNSSGQVSINYSANVQTELAPTIANIQSIRTPAEIVNVETGNTLHESEMKDVVKEPLVAKPSKAPTPARKTPKRKRKILLGNSKANHQPFLPLKAPFEAIKVTKLSLDCNPDAAQKRVASAKRPRPDKESLRLVQRKEFKFLDPGDIRIPKQLQNQIQCVTKKRGASAPKTRTQTKPAKRETPPNNFSERDDFLNYVRKIDRECRARMRRQNVFLLQRKAKRVMVSPAIDTGDYEMTASQKWNRTSEGVTYNSQMRIDNDLEVVFDEELDSMPQVVDKSMSKTSQLNKKVSHLNLSQGLVSSSDFVGRRPATAKNALSRSGSQQYGKNLLKNYSFNAPVQLLSPKQPIEIQQLVRPLITSNSNSNSLLNANSDTTSAKFFQNKMLKQSLSPPMNTEEQEFIKSKEKRRRPETSKELKEFPQKTAPYRNRYNISTAKPRFNNKQ